MENIVDMCREHNFRDEAANAVDLYLSENGITGWMNDDKYFSVYAYLNKALKASQKVMERR
ncbi:MAG: hypothetical protein IK088_01965 [Lachnospiraceae bacterium]|nr:hypothetical protein [Lachnospiraceae bacterium]